MSSPGDDLFSPGSTTTSGSLSYPASTSSFGNHSAQPSINQNNNPNSARNSFRAPSSRASRRAGQHSIPSFPTDVHSGPSSIKENSSSVSSNTVDPVEEYRIRIKKTLDERVKQCVAVGGLGIEIVKQRDELAVMMSEIEGLKVKLDQSGDEDGGNGNPHGVDAMRLKDMEEKLRVFEADSARLFSELDKTKENQLKSVRSNSPSEGLPSTSLYPIPGATGIRAPLNSLFPTSDNLPIPTSSSSDVFPTSTSTTQSPALSHASNSTTNPKPNSTVNIHQLVREAQLSKGVTEQMVIEIRRLQILVEERDAQILGLKGEKGEVERKLEPLVAQMKALEKQNSDLADDIWSVQTERGDLDEKNVELGKRVDKQEAEAKRLGVALTDALLEIDHHKNEVERLGSVVAKLRSDHQTDLARFKGEVQQKQIQNDQLQTELERTKKVINDTNNARGYSASPSPSLNSPAASTPLSTRTVGRQMDDEDVFSSQNGLVHGHDNSGSFSSPGDRSFDSQDNVNSPAGRSATSSSHPTLADHIARDETVRDLQAQLAATQAENARLRSRPKDSLSPSSDMSDSPSLRRSGLPNERASQRLATRGVIRARKSSGMMRSSPSPSTLGRSVFSVDDEEDLGAPTTPARAVTLADDLDPTYGATPGSGSSTSSDARSRRSDTDSPLQPMSKRSHAPRNASSLRNLSALGLPGSPASPMDLASSMRFADEDDEDEEDQEDEDVPVEEANKNVSLSPETPHRALYVNVGVDASDFEEDGASTVTPTADSFPSIPSTATVTALILTPPRPTRAPVLAHIGEATPMAQRQISGRDLLDPMSPQDSRPSSPSYTDNMTTDNEGETDYEDARTTGTLTPGHRSPQGTESPYETAISDADDFMSFGQQSSADNDSDAESIRASARPRPTGAKRFTLPSMGSTTIEKIVYQEMPVDTLREVLLAVFASREIVRGIPAVRTEIKHVEVERLVEVPVEKLVYQEMPSDTLRHALLSVFAGKEIVRGIPAIKIETRDVIVEKLVEVPVEKLVYHEMPAETLRTALLAALAGKEVIRGIPAIKTEYRDIIVEKVVEVPVEKIVYQDLPAETLQHALTAMFRNKEIVRGIPAIKTVVEEKVVEKIVEVPVIKTETKWNDVPHHQLRDIFGEIFKAKEVVRDNVIVRPPIINTVEVMRDVPHDTLRDIFGAIFAGREIVKQVHTHSVTERTIEVPTYHEVPHDTLRDIFAKFAKARDISRPIHTHSVSVREVEVPKEVIREVEVIKEVPTPYETIKEVEVVKYVDKPVEVIREVPTPYETIKEVEVIKYVDKPVEVIKEVPVPFETIKEVEVIKYVDKHIEVIKEVPTPYETIKEVEVIKYVDKPVEVIREVPTPYETIKEVEVIKYVDKPIEIIKEVPTPYETIKEVEVIRYIDKPIEVIKEVPTPYETIKVVEVIRYVDKPVEVIREVQVPFETIREVEKIVDREVPVPFEVIKEVIKEVEVIREVQVPVDVIREVEKVVEMEVRVPYETIKEVEKIVEVPVEVIREVEKIVDRIVEVPVEVIREVEKIVDREVKVPFETIREIEVEKIVEVPVDVVREVEKIVEVPVEVIREVEKIVDREVPVPFEVIREVEKIVIQEVQVPFEVIREVERIVEKEVPITVEVIREVEKIVEKEVKVPFETIKEVERIVEVPVEVVREVQVIQRIEVPVEVIKEVPVEREVYRDMVVPVQIHRLAQKDAQTQTDAYSTQIAPDMALYRVNSGNSYDFLKGPPSESTSSKRISAALARRQSKASGRALDRSALASDNAMVDHEDQGNSSSDNADSPIMTVPPPPVMPPPSTLPVKRMIAHAPPRPQSSPPSSYVQRSVTPSSPFLTPAPPTHRRNNSASTPAENTGMRKPSTSSLRSAAHAADRADGPTGSTHKFHTISSSAIHQSREAVKRRADVVINPDARPRQISDNRSIAQSFATSVRSSDYGLPQVQNDWEASSNWDGVAGGSTDPAVIQAITQTMIGEFLWKSTRKAFGSALSDNKHQRFFWIHPYTRTLYWSPVDPGHEKTNESKAKSIFITNVRVQDDPGHDEQHDIWRQSLIVSAASRDIRITAPSKDRHNAWVTALTYLVARPSQSTMSGRTTFVPVPAASLTTPARRGGDHVDDAGIDDFGATASGRRHRASGSASMRSYKTQTATPKNEPPRSQSALSNRRRSSAKSVGRQASNSVSGKRPGTAAHEYMMQSDSEWREPRPDLPTKSHRPAMSMNSQSGRRSLRSMGRIQSGIEADFDRVERAEAEDEGTDGYEGLDNVRACCEGKHDLGSLAHGQHGHRRPHTTRRTSAHSGHSADYSVLGEIHPRSPSGRAFSFRSTERNSVVSDDATPTHARTISKGKQPIRRAVSQALGAVNNENAGSTPVASGKQSMRRKTVRKPSFVGGAV